jgi:hypothetical protein
MQLHESRSDIVRAPGLDDPMTKAILTEAHRGFVGRQQFCRSCDCTLDYRKAVDITAMRDDRPCGTVIICAACFDARGQGHHVDGVVFHVIDGREL